MYKCIIDSCIYLNYSFIFLWIKLVIYALYYLEVFLLDLQFHCILHTAMVVILDVRWEQRVAGLVLLNLLVKLTASSTSYLHFYKTENVYFCSIELTQTLRMFNKSYRGKGFINPLSAQAANLAGYKSNPMCEDHQIGWLIM